MVRFLSLCLFCMPAFADIYKCEVDGKIIYSERPCAEDAEKVEVEDTDRGLQVDKNFVRNQDAETNRVLHNQNIDLEIQEIRRSAARRIADYRQKRDNCDETTYRGPNNASSARREQTVKECINGFEALIQEEELRRDDAIRELRRDRREP